MNEDELELHENEVIEILGEVEEGWWRGKLNNKACCSYEGHGSSV